MKNYTWKKLSRQQLGKFAEYYSKMELTLHSFQVYSPEIDDRGIDFITRYKTGPLFEIQVKSVRNSGYVYMEKSKFKLKDNLFCFLLIFNEGQPPDLFLIPSLEWNNPTNLLKDRKYKKEQKSKDEWGINISQKNMPLLQKFAFDKQISQLKQA